MPKELSDIGVLGSPRTAQSLKGGCLLLVYCTRGVVVQKKTNSPEMDEGVIETAMAFAIRNRQWYTYEIEGADLSAHLEPAR